MSEVMTHVCFGVVRGGNVVVVGGELPPEGTKVFVTLLKFKPPRPFLDADGNPIKLSEAEYAELVKLNHTADAASVAPAEETGAKPTPSGR